jgi:hypothetical protein
MKTWFCPFACEQAVATPNCGATECCCSGGCDADASDVPIRTPKPCPKKCTCPCLDRHMTLLAKASVEKPDASAILFLPLLDVVEIGVNRPAAVVETHPSERTQSLQVWLCVWRC